MSKKSDGDFFESGFGKFLIGVAAAIGAIYTFLLAASKYFMITVMVCMAGGVVYLLFLKEVFYALMLLVPLLIWYAMYRHFTSK
ncbi:hypothetical protein [Paenibacillus mucilaginosus]|uniref:Uncharacterized protein n=3 Tax=Paenibacillus mucilaginosus TaxID=61624 RepID=H6NRP4_9BACL|nr:hypothetical protein [Paenibacillus mucilaginosus]AEI39027.1 hypothetical protein KNP414_00402 [Paenibacillus mucilaginosus KNP414]AFC27326.1 hypothetical protein PM3016_350 [Paenibacillus mucilaginosus 3016]AFH59471.1 hypothetical protein B2K_01790 [Paenibacillus mucilaginosus K02]MCG7216161.1 hypothetical protein [Paenibacillus mucilaginosus]WDM28065.1 hypothetical protein KCX80_01925 [Paenibacillus mucilaginosus]